MTGPAFTEEDFVTAVKQTQGTNVTNLQMQLAVEEGEAVFSAKKNEWKKTLKISHADLRYCVTHSYVLSHTSY